MFEKLLETNLINFLIMFWLLGLIFKKAKLGELISKMAQDVKKRIDESAKKAADAVHAFEETKAGALRIASTQEKIITDAKNTASAMEKNIQHEARKCEAELEQSFRGVVESLGSKAKEETLSKIYKACVALAGDEVMKNLDEQTHKHLIEQGIDEISKMENICL